MPVSRTSLQKTFAILRQGLRARFSRVDSRSADRYLIVQLASLGDVCLLLRSVRVLAAQGIGFDVVCREAYAPLWRHFFPDAEIFPVETESWQPPVLANLRSRLARRTYGAVFVTSLSPFAAFAESLVRAPRRFGIVEGGRFYRGSRLLYTGRYAAGVNEHVAQRYAGLFAMEFGQDAVRPVPLPLEKPAGDGYVLLHPGGKWKPRRWPVARFVELGQIIHRAGAKVVVVAHPQEQEILAAFTPVQEIGIQVAENIDQLLQAVASCTLFIGNDSGPAHLANLLGKQTIVLWGPGNDRRIRPLGENNTIIKKEIACRPCRQYVHPDRCEQGENLCLQMISVDEVFEKVQEKLSYKNAHVLP